MEKILKTQYFKDNDAISDSICYIYLYIFTGIKRHTHSYEKTSVRSEYVITML